MDSNDQPYVHTTIVLSRSSRCGGDDCIYRLCMRIICHDTVVLSYNYSDYYSTGMITLVCLYVITADAFVVSIPKLGSEYSHKHTICGFDILKFEIACSRSR